MLATRLFSCYEAGRALPGNGSLPLSQSSIGFSFRKQPVEQGAFLHFLLDGVEHGSNQKATCAPSKDFTCSTGIQVVVFLLILQWENEESPLWLLVRCLENSRFFMQDTLSHSGLCKTCWAYVEHMLDQLQSATYLCKLLSEGPSSVCFWPTLHSAMAFATMPLAVCRNVHFEV